MNLSPRQVEVVELIATGSSDKEIAEQLGISEETVANHLREIFQRLQAKSRAHAVATYIFTHLGGGVPH